MRSTAVLSVLALMLGCGSEQPAEKSGEVATPTESIGGEAGEAIEAFLKRDPSLKTFFDDSHGFAIWPKVGKGGLIVGGGGGRGYVFEQGKQVGTSKMSFISVGAQIGGQSFSEVIFFKNEAALVGFKQGNFEFSAQVSAIAADEGVGSKSDYENGVAVFTLPLGGLMAEASVSGQKFTYEK